MSQSYAAFWRMRTPPLSRGARALRPYYHAKLAEMARSLSALVIELNAPVLLMRQQKSARKPPTIAATCRFAEVKRNASGMRQGDVRETSNGKGAAT